MQFRRILITGGSGFVGSTLALALKRQWPEVEVTAMDNLKRRGSELLLPRLAQAGIGFRHGDVRTQDDFPAEAYDLLIECSGEASVLAGYTSSPDYLLQTNLQGAVHCLEYCRRTGAALLFLSTSRVYSVEPLSQLALEETWSRYELRAEQTVPGAGANGIAETFPTGQFRSLYGTTKLAAEMLIEEYRRAYGLKAVVNRCGVLAGPWQLARSDQGIFTYWMASHYFGRPLQYIGFSGSGRQVRDLLHPADLAALMVEQLTSFESWDGAVLNVGGGREISLSLREATALCVEITGRTVPVTAQPEPRAMDVPVYLSDCRALHARTAWRPTRDARQIMQEIYQWIAANEGVLRDLL